MGRIVGNINIILIIYRFLATVKGNTSTPETETFDPIIPIPSQHLVFNGGIGFIHTYIHIRCSLFTRHKRSIQARQFFFFFLVNKFASSNGILLS